MTLWLLFLLLSVVFCLGWGIGSSLGYQAGRHDAEELLTLQNELVRSIEEHLSDQQPVPTSR